MRVTGVASLLAVVCLCAQTAASVRAQPNIEIADPIGAAALVAHVADEAAASLGSGRLSHLAAAARLRGSLDDNFNLRYISLLALGAHRHFLGDETLKAYDAEFGDYFAMRVASLLNIGGATSIKIEGLERVGARDTLVTTRIERRQGPLQVEWRVRVFERVPQIIDISVAGTSVVEVQRREIDAWVEEAGADGLMEHMRHVSGGDPG